MIIDYEGQTPTTTCGTCGSTVEVLELYVKGSGLHCPICVLADFGTGHIGYVGDLRDCQFKECHLIKIGE